MRMAINLLHAEPRPLARIGRWSSMVWRRCREFGLNAITVTAIVTAAVLMFVGMEGARAPATPHPEETAAITSTMEHDAATNALVTEGIHEGVVRTITVDVPVADRDLRTRGGAELQRQFTTTVNRAIAAWLAEHRGCRIQSTNVLMFRANLSVPTGMYITFTCDTER